MSLKPLRDWFAASSLRKMVLVQALIYVSTLCLFLGLAQYVMQQDMRATARKLMERDIAVYAHHFEESWHLGLNDDSTVARERLHDCLRVTQPDGYGVRTVTESMARGLRPFEWERLPAPALKEGEFDWQILRQPGRKTELRVLRLGLADGRTFWYGRTDAEERQYIAGAINGLAILAAVCLLAISIPLGWFGARVLDPLRRLTASARRIVNGWDHSRLVTGKAIPEINAFAQTFNESQERIAALTDELNSVNDHLAHELKTPLARVRGNIEMLLDHYGEPEGAETAERSLEEIDRASQLVRNILAIRIGASGAMKLHLEMTSPFEFLSDIIETYTPAAEDKDLEFAFECESERLVLMDRQRMRQAITNLLDNAFAYTPRGGSITVLQRATATGLTVIVSDTGPGLKGDDAKKIWKRFERGSAGRSSDVSTGLGLPLVRAVAQAHFGYADCGNRPGGGAEFWINIPLAPRTEEGRDLKRLGDMREFINNATVSSSPQIALESKEQEPSEGPLAPP